MWTFFDNLGVIVSTLLATAVLLLVCNQVYAHDGTHGVGHSRLHHWYRTLMRPDLPSSSCCNETDCRVTDAGFVDGKWRAKKDGQWIEIPEAKINREESYDSQAHICAPPATSQSYPADYIFCFVKPGAGI